MTNGAMILSHIRKATVAFGYLRDGTEPTIVGSGVIVNGGKWVLTATHVLVGMRSEVNDMGDGWTPFLMAPRDTVAPTKEGRLTLRHHGYNVRKLEWAQSDREDISAISLPDKKFGSNSVTVNFGYKPTEGSDIVTCGWPYGLEMHGIMTSSLVFGQISAILPHPSVDVHNVASYTVQVPVCPGNSGGGVFDRMTGHLIGIVSARREVNGISLGLAEVVPVQFIYAALS